MPAGSDIFGNIVVIGSTGVGKSTLAARIAVKTGRAPIDLDDCYWSPGWREATVAEFHARIQAAMDAAGPGGWVVAGNYSKAESLVWPQAQTVIGLDYSWMRVFFRLLARTLSRCWTGRPVCNGNRETFAKAFLSKESLFLWFFKNFGKRRRKLQALIDDPGACAHLRVLRHKTPQETERWLTTL